MDIVIVSVVTLVSVGASLYMYALSNIQKLKADWPLYRCNPAYMPLAGLVGEDPFGNFTDCTMKNFHDYTGFVMDPIMSQFSQMTDIVSGIGGAMDSMRSMISDTRSGFLGIVGMVFGKIQNLMSQFQYIIIRMRTLLARVIGIMMSFMYIFYGGMDTGKSVMNGPVGQTMNFLCFDPNTLLKLQNGTEVRMQDIPLGSILENGSTVTSLYTLDGTGVSMYNLYGVVVSGNHRVLVGKNPIQVSQHPDAVPTPELRRLSCLNTSTHTIRIGHVVFMDFIETTKPVFLEVRRNLTELHYNGCVSPHNMIKSPTSSYPTGLTRETRVLLKNGRAERIDNIIVGDVLDTGERVLGVVVHNGNNTYYGEVEKGITAHPCCWVFEDRHVRTVESYQRIAKQVETMQLFNLITDSCMFPVVSDSGNRYLVLGELEITHWFFERFKNRYLTSVA